MITVYGISNCNTMKKTFDWLKENKINFQFHDYKKKGISKEMIQTFVEQLGEQVVLNKQGTTFKQLSDVQKVSLSNLKDLIPFLTEKTSAIKRPIIEKNGQFQAGFDIDQLTKFMA